MAPSTLLLVLAGVGAALAALLALPTNAYPIIGVNDGAGWGAAAAKPISSAGLVHDRVSYSYPSMTPDEYSIETSVSEGFKPIVILNSADNTPLSKISAAEYAAKGVALIKKHPHVGLFEILNEAYLKGGHADPASYARLAMALYDKYDASGLKGHKLLLNSFGDYQLPSGSWSSIDHKPIAGWLGKLLETEPRLRRRADGFTCHHYGRVGENGGNDGGEGALEKQHLRATQLGFTNAGSYYITEVGHAPARQPRKLW
jgi:hypothetical protein